MQHVILPVHGFHFFKVAKGHHIKAKTPKIISIFGAFAQSTTTPNKAYSQTNFSCFTYIRVTLRSLRKIFTPFLQAPFYGKAFDLILQLS